MWNVYIEKILLSLSRQHIENINYIIIKKYVSLIIPQKYGSLHIVVILSNFLVLSKKVWGNERMPSQANRYVINTSK